MTMKCLRCHCLWIAILASPTVHAQAEEQVSAVPRESCNILLLGRRGSSFVICGRGASSAR